MDWEVAPASVRERTAVSGEVMEERVLLAAPVAAEADESGQTEVNLPETEGAQKGAETGRSGHSSSSACWAALAATCCSKSSRYA